MLKLKTRGRWYHVQGKNALGVHIPPHSIGIAVLDEYTHRAALARLFELEKATQWPLPEAKPEPPKPNLIDVYKDWLAKAPEGSKSWWSRHAIEKAIITPLTQQGVISVADVTPRHLDELQCNWLKPRPGGKHRYKFNTIKSWRQASSCLFNHCVNVLRILQKNPWHGVPVIKEIRPTVEEIMCGKRKDTGVATLPIDLDRSQHNWRKIQDNARAYAKGEMPGQYARRDDHAIWRHPDTWPTFLRLLYETGLRRSDALIFRPDRIKATAHGGSYTTLQRKTGDAVTVFVPQALVEQLRALPLLPWLGRRELYEQATGKAWTPGAGLYPFYDGSLESQDSYMTVRISDPLREFGKLLGIRGSLRCHRFRDSFAVNMLALGVPLQDLQRMLGHKSIATTEKYYAPYVPGIQDAIEERVAAARKRLLHFAEAQQASPLTVN